MLPIRFYGIIPGKRGLLNATPLEAVTKATPLRLAAPVAFGTYRHFELAPGN